MEEEKLRKTLQKIHPEQALVERVKQKRTERVRSVRYAYVCAGAGALLLAAGLLAVGLHRPEPDSPRPISVLRETQTRFEVPMALDREAVIFLDAYSPEEQRRILEMPEENTICYTEDISALLEQYGAYLPEFLAHGQEDTAVLVFRDGAWHWEMMEDIREYREGR